MTALLAATQSYGRQSDHWPSFLICIACVFLLAAIAQYGPRNTR